MINMKTFLNGAVILTGAFTLAAPTSAAAGNLGLTDHLVAEKPYAQYASQLPPERKLELEKYLEYQQREPCQNYLPVPEGFVSNGCELEQEGQKMASATTKRKDKASVLKHYEVHFEFDESEIEPKANRKLDRVANEIDKYNPREVTVAGFTDTAGPASYNKKLSERRAKSVSDALTDRGVKNRILDSEAYGENWLAVNTKDGVRKRENRRVLIEFRK